MEDSALGTNVAAQIAIVVRDIEETAVAWAELLGVPKPEILTTNPVELAHTEYEGSPTEARARLAFFNLGQVTLELIEPIDKPSTWNDQLQEAGQSLHHIAFKVEGMKDRLPRLRDLGLPLVQCGEYTGGRYAYLDGRKKYGAVIELLEND